MPLIKIIRSRRDAGFSLIEFTVATSLIVMIAAIVLVNYRGASFTESMVRNAFSLASDVRLTQNSALAPTMVTSSPQAYGLFFDLNNPTRYVVFLDRDGDQTYDPPAAGCKSPISECLEQRLFETQARIVTLKAVSPAGVQTTPANVTALFCPPYATTLLYAAAGARGSGCAGNQAIMQASLVVTLGVVGVSVTTDIQRNVAISASGAVEVLADSQA